MASLTIRNLEEPLKAQLRVRAAHHGHSMEEEARQILRAGLKDTAKPAQSLAASIAQRFKGLGEAPSAPPRDELVRDPPGFE
jgi:plasmid stability protein